MTKPSTTVSRGYGAEHRELRDRWSQLFTQGHTAHCACSHEDCPIHEGACPVVISKTVPWDLGHTDDRRDWTGPECIPCNRSAGGRNSRAGQANPMTIRAWCAAIGTT